jgi:trk system potassium uptake protein TrkH
MRFGPLLFLAIVALLVGVDFVLATPASGAAAAVVLAMGAAITVASARRLLFHGGRLRGLASLEGGLVAALVLFAGVRAWVAWQRLGGSGDPFATVGAGRNYDALAVVFLVAAWVALDRVPQVARLLAMLARNPLVLLPLSFAGAIAVTTVMLTLPFSVRALEGVSFIDALFTAASAVCVTGLAVNDVGATYTTFGHGMILAAMQFGGIGIMTAAAFILVLGRGAPLVEHARYARLYEISSLGELRRTVRAIIGWTLAIELAGAVLLWTLWRDSPEVPAGQAAWYAVFHAVSAFCNAGFTLFPSGLVPFRHDEGVLTVVMALIVLGGLGFPVLREVLRGVRDRLRWRTAPRRIRPFTVGTGVVLRMTALLLALGTLGVLLLERNGALAGRTPDERILNALFLSVTSRTAGLHTIEITAFAPATLLLLIGLMWIGGGPVSTAGGVKVTTAAVLWAMLRGELSQDEPRLGGRRLSANSMRRAVAVAILSQVLVMVLLGLLVLAEGGRNFLGLMFETVSAFCTVGLSLALTPTLSGAGKLILVVTMFVGRVGPLVIANAVSAPRPLPIRLPETNLPVG